MIVPRRLQATLVTFHVHRLLHVTTTTTSPVIPEVSSSFSIARVTVGIVVLKVSMLLLRRWTVLSAVLI